MPSGHENSLMAELSETVDLRLPEVCRTCVRLCDRTTVHVLRTLSELIFEVISSFLCCKVKSVITTVQILTQRPSNFPPPLPGQAPLLCTLWGQPDRSECLRRKQIQPLRNSICWLPSTNMISAGKRTHRLSLLSDCAISIPDEREVHEQAPNFRIFKVTAPSVFFPPLSLSLSRRGNKTDSQPHRPLSLLTPKFPLYLSHEYANCAFFSPRTCDASEGMDIVPVNKQINQKQIKQMKGGLCNWLLKEKKTVIRMEKEDVSFALFNLAPAPLPMALYASSFLSCPT